MDVCVKTWITFIFFCAVVIKNAQLLYNGQYGRYPNPRLQIPTKEQNSGLEKAEEITQASSESKPLSGPTDTLYTIFYSLPQPRSRGGKNLNFTLPGSSEEGYGIQARIVNNPNLYLRLPSFPIRSTNTRDNRRISRKTYGKTDNSDFSSRDQQLLERLDRNHAPDPFNKIGLKQIRIATSSAKPTSNKNNIDLNPPSVSLSKTFNRTISSATLAYARRQYDGKPYSSCVCVPYFLCKNGFVNSGGRYITADKRSTKSSPLRNKSLILFNGEPKIMHQYTVRNNSSPNVCEENTVCCQLTFPEENDDAELYPVATPIPDSASFPDKRKDHNVCGIRKAYGVQSRLSQLQYPPDVSEFGEYPWQIAVLKKVEGEKNLYLCGGALVSPQWVATVAHCVQKEEIAWLLVRLGEWDVNRKDEIYPFVEEYVTAILIHPEFDEETLENDLALLRIRTPVDPKIPHISPVCLPSYGQAFEGQRCWVSGWGKDFFGPQGEYQNVLKEVDVPVLNYDICNNELRNTKLGPAYILHPSFLCAGGEEGKDACTGDGGSPLVCKSGRKWYVAGLVSWGIGCGLPGVPGIYINIQYYLNWINSVIWL